MIAARTLAAMASSGVAETITNARRSRSRGCQFDRQSLGRGESLEEVRLPDHLDRMSRLEEPCCLLVFGAHRRARHEPSGILVAYDKDVRFLRYPRQRLAARLGNEVTRQGPRHAGECPGEADGQAVERAVGVRVA